MTAQEQELLDACSEFERSQFYSATRPVDAAFAWKVWLAAWRAVKAVDSILPEKPTPAMLDAMRVGSFRDWPSDELCRVRYAALRAAIMSNNPK